MSIFQRSFGKIFAVLALVFLLATTTACGATATRPDRTSYQPGIERGVGYGALERGDTAKGQNFGDWVVKTSQGLVQDAYVRDNDKLGVVISPKVRPAEVRSLARSLVQGFHNSAPQRDLTVLVYAPDKQLILTAHYNARTNQVEYDA
jgi:hypothetical protein